jgi:type II secretory pathway pseudopilin PulG
VCPDRSPTILPSPERGVDVDRFLPDDPSVDTNVAQRFSRVVARLRSALSAQEGFTLVETMMAGVILVILLAGIGGVLTSSIAAHTVARDRTAAEQCANDAVELVRRLPSYQNDVGTNPGNPAGKLSQTQACGNNQAMTAHIDIRLVDDPTPTSYSGDNYKRVTVWVTRDRDNVELARVVTLVSPSGRPTCPSCGATLNVTVLDLGSQQPYPGATVNLANGPTANRSDTSDSSGSVSFGALDPNPASGSQAFYDVTVSGLPSGYQTLAADVPPGTATLPTSAAHVQLAPSQTSASTIRVFKAATINLALTDGSGNPFTSGANVTVQSSFTGSTYSVTVPSGTSTQTISTLGGQPVIPGATYTIKGYTTTGLCAAPSPSPVPASGYPTTTSGSFTLAFTPCPTGTLAINVQQLSANAAGASVTVSGGPNSMTFTGLITNASGNVSVDVPVGSGYTVTATKLSQSASTSATAVVSSTTNVSLTLPNPPTGSLLVTATWGTALASCTNCVTLTGGPLSISVTGSTDASGQVTFSNVVAGSGYTVTATKAGVSGTASATVVASTTTPVAVALPTGTVNATVKWGGSLAASGATLSITGGPNSVNLTGLTANASGIYSTTLPAGSATTYTITATKAGQSTSTTFTLPTNGSVATVSLNLPVGTVNATVRWGAAGAFSNGATITITGGPEGSTISGTTNASGVYSNALMPAGTGTYTITATKGTATVNTTFTIASSGAVANVNLTLPIRTSVVVTVQNSAGAGIGAGASVTLIGGAEGLTFSGTTNASSQVTFTNVPASTNTYTAKGWNCATSGSKSNTSTVTVTTGATAQAVTLKFNSATCPP